MIWTCNFLSSSSSASSWESSSCDRFTTSSSSRKTLPAAVAATCVIYQRKRPLQDHNPVSFFIANGYHPASLLPLSLVFHAQTPANESISKMNYVFEKTLQYRMNSFSIIYVEVIGTNIPEKDLTYSHATFCVLSHLTNR